MIKDKAKLLLLKALNEIGDGQPLCQIIGNEVAEADTVLIIHRYFELYYDDVVKILEMLDKEITAENIVNEFMHNIGTQEGYIPYENKNKCLIKWHIKEADRLTKIELKKLDKPEIALPDCNEQIRQVLEGFLTNNGFKVKGV